MHVHEVLNDWLPLRVQTGISTPAKHDAAKMQTAGCEILHDLTQQLKAHEPATKVKIPTISQLSPVAFCRGLAAVANELSPTSKWNH